ncbi:MAG: hypothetical protein IKN55_02735 [Oscillospiraceae bacterium]|nr:hypothetical protein [Oscillospiraceae bacterium]
MPRIRKEKDLFGDEHIIVTHDDGTESDTTKDVHLFGDIFGDESYTTRNQDGSVDHTVKTGPGRYDTRHEDGTITHYRDLGYGSWRAETEDPFAYMDEPSIVTPYMRTRERLVSSEENRRRRLPTILAGCTVVGIFLVLALALTAILTIQSMRDPESITNVLVTDVPLFMRNVFLSFGAVGLICSVVFIAMEFFFVNFAEDFYDAFFFKRSNIPISIRKLEGRYVVVDSVLDGETLARKKKFNLLKKLLFIGRIVLPLAAFVVGSAVYVTSKWLPVIILLGYILLMLLLRIPLPKYKEKFKRKGKRKGKR